jgi:hypothetical protein
MHAYDRAGSHDATPSSCLRLIHVEADQQKNSSRCPAESRVIPNPHKKSYSVITLFTIILTRCFSR